MSVLPKARDTNPFGARSVAPIDDPLRPVRMPVQTGLFRLVACLNLRVALLPNHHCLIQRVVSASHRGQRYVPALSPVPASAFPSAMRSIISKQLGQVTWPMGSVCRRSSMSEFIIASSPTGIQGVLFGSDPSLASLLVCEPLLADFIA